MKRVARDKVAWRAVHIVALNRTAEVREMHAKLMRSSRNGSGKHQSMRITFANNLIFGNRAVAARAFAADFADDNALFGAAHISINNSIV